MKKIIISLMLICLLVLVGCNPSKPEIKEKIEQKMEDTDCSDLICPECCDAKFKSCEVVCNSFWMVNARNTDVGFCYNECNDAWKKCDDSCLVDVSELEEINYTEQEAIPIEEEYSSEDIYVKGNVIVTHEAHCDWVHSEYGLDTIYVIDSETGRYMWIKDFNQSELNCIAGYESVNPVTHMCDFVRYRDGLLFSRYDYQIDCKNSCFIVRKEIGLKEGYQNLNNEEMLYETEKRCW